MPTVGNLSEEHERKTYKRKTGCINFNEDIKCASSPPLIKKMATTLTGSSKRILVSSHRSTLSWLCQVEDNSDAWAKLIVEGLKTGGDAGLFIRKIDMKQYQVVETLNCPKPEVFSYEATCNMNDEAERVVKDFLSRLS